MRPAEHRRGVDQLALQRQPEVVLDPAPRGVEGEPDLGLAGPVEPEAEGRTDPEERLPLQDVPDVLRTELSGAAQLPAGDPVGALRVGVEHRTAAEPAHRLNAVRFPRPDRDELARLADQGVRPFDPEPEFRIELPGEQGGSILPTVLTVLVIDPPQRTVLVVRLQDYARGLEDLADGHLAADHRELFGRRRGRRADRADRPGVRDSARRTGRPAQVVEQVSRELSPLVPLERPLEPVQQLVRQHRVRHGRLGVADFRMEDRDPLERTFRRRDPVGRVLRAEDAAVGIDEQQGLHQHHGERVPVGVGVMGMNQPRPVRRAVPRIDEPGREDPARVASELEAVRVDQVRLGPVHQYVEVVEISNDHSGPVDAADRAVQVPEDLPDGVVGYRLAEGPFGVAHQHVAADQPHAVSADRLSRFVRDQPFRHDHPVRQFPREPPELGLVLGDPGFGTRLGGRLAVVVGMPRRLEDLEGLAADVVDVGLAALADRLAGIETDRPAVHVHLHGSASFGRGFVLRRGLRPGRPPDDHRSVVRQ